MKIVTPCPAYSYSALASTPFTFSSGANPGGTGSQTGQFNAYVTQSPGNNATVKGVVRIIIQGEFIANAELLPEFGYTPIYARFIVAGDGRSAYVDFDTSSLTDRTQKFRVSAYDTPPNDPTAKEIVVFVQSWTIQNGAVSAPTTNPSSVIVGYYGASSVKGTNGDGSPQFVSQPVPALLANAYPGLTVQNKGIESVNTTMLLNGTGYVASNGWNTNWDTEMSKSTATHIICNSAINDYALSDADFRSNYLALRAAAIAHGKVFIFETPHPTYQTLSGGTSPGSDLTVMMRADLMKSIAAENNDPVIDTFYYINDWLKNNGHTWPNGTAGITDSNNNQTVCKADTFAIDGLHPNQTGYNKISEIVISRFGNIAGLVAGSNPTPVPGTGGSTGSVTMMGPTASNFNSTATFFDDFDGTTLSNKWSSGLWYHNTQPNNTMRLNNGCIEFTGQSDSMFTGADATEYSVICTDPAMMSNGFQQKYGVFQVEAKMPAGKGYWPAFWMFNHPGDHRPEVDIFEIYPGAGSATWDDGGTPPHPVRADVTVHPLDDPGGYQADSVPNFKIAEALDISAAFHTYTFEWDASYMKFYLDGVLKGTVTDQSVLNWFNQFPLYIILGLGINYSTAGGPSNNASITPYGFGSDPNNPPVNVFRVKYIAAWQFNKYLG